MMFAEMHVLDSLAPQKLDDYLAKGWFRMNQTIFTTHFLQFNQHFYSAIWLRIALDNYIPDKKHLQLQKMNSAFKTEIKKAVISEAQEQLYALYKQGITFEPASTLHHLLLGIGTKNIFNTYQVSVYDKETLIATGFFDLGSKTAAGITCFYHSAYKKYSLGKYLMFLKIDFCRQQQLDYFYPGYLVPGYSPFDYKASIGKAKLEYFAVSTKEWLPYSTFSPSQNPLLKMQEKLSELQAKLKSNNMVTTLYHYRFFDSNIYPSCAGLHLFDFPVFLSFAHSVESNTYLLMVYDVRDNNFHVVECMSIGRIDEPFETSGIFSVHLLKVYQTWLCTDQFKEISDLLISIVAIENV